MRFASLAISFATLFAACSPAVDPSDSLGKSGDAEVLNLTRPAVDALTLFVTDLQISHMQVKGANVGSLYLAASGDSDFVELSICHSKGCEATRKETANRIVFPPFPNEQILFKARACVNPERATDAAVLCGPWKESTWSQPPNVNQALVELLAMRDKYRAELEEMGARLRQVLVRYEKDLAKCTQRKENGADIARMRSIVSNFVNLGEQLVMRAMSPGSLDGGGFKPRMGRPSGEGLIPNVNVNGVLKSAGATASKLNVGNSREMQTSASNMQKAAQQGSGASVSYDLASQDPVGGLRGLATAIVDMTSASEQVDALRPCFAESRAESISEVAKKRIAEIRAKLDAVEQKIQSAGGG